MFVVLLSYAGVRKTLLRWRRVFAPPYFLFNVFSLTAIESGELHSIVIRLVGGNQVEREEFSKTYEKNGAKYIMMPGNAKRRHPIVEERTAALTEYAETSPINRLEDGNDRSIGIITSSTSYQYAKEVCGDKYPVLKLGMINPLPIRKILDFANSVSKVKIGRASCRERV